MIEAVADSLWTYRARLEGIVDGDTLDVLVDCGFRNFRSERLRLLGVNTPEMKGATRYEGLAAKVYVNAWMAEARVDEWSLVIQTEKSDAFGRFLARVWRITDGRCLNDDLLANGHAVPFAG